MIKKTYIGIAAGLLACLSIYIIIKYKKEDELFSGEDFPDENDLLDKANYHLLLARNKADKMIHEAEEKSNSILDKAGKILSSAKDKTSSIHYDLKESAETEINKIKEEIEESIDEFRKKFGL